MAGDQGEYKDAAGKELQTLSFVRQQLARPDSILVKTQKLNAPNSNERGVYAAAHVGGDQFLITSTQKDSFQVNGVNPYHSHLFYATLNNGSLEEMFPAAIVAATPITNQGAATVSAGGNYLYFSQWKKENAHLPDRQGKTVSSIYFSARRAEGWSAPALLPSVNVSGYSSKQPFCSTDGKYLFFSSDRPGGSGGFDIWYAPLKDDGSTGEPVNVGSTINSSDDEQAPFYHTSSSTLIFSSNGRLGMGGYDLFAATGSDTNWKTVENLGYPVNSSRDDIYFFAPEKTSLLSNAIFSSDRGEGCCLETYNVKKAPKSKHLTGIVRDCKDNMVVAEAKVILKDATGNTWQASTNADGKYEFNLDNKTHPSLTFLVSKELYQDTTASSNIEKIDEVDLLIDQLTNADVCIEKKPEEKPQEKIVIKAEDVVTVFFDFDNSILKSEAISKLDSIYNILVENPAATIQISGYTDGLGSVAYNDKLSDRRARACANYLVQKGIESSRVSFVSFGKCCPVEMEIINGRDNPDGRSRNRRALINVKKD
jgi:outer membrane protein OmpA-like peptidoglycan-associated protein